MDWNDLSYFAAVAETGSTMAAGQRLGVSQTTAARRVAVLEVALGVRLFERLPSGYRLTEQGRALLPFALEMRRTAEELVDAASAAVRDVSGTVRLTAPEVIAVTVLTPILGDFHDAFPSIRIEMDTSDAVRDLAAGAADIAIRVCVRPDGAGLVARRVATDNWTVYCSRGYAERRGRPRRRSELPGHTLIGGGEAGIRRYYQAWLDGNGLSDAVAMNHDTSIGLLAAVRAGIGIAALPCIVADGDPDLLRCLRPDQGNERGIWLMTHEQLRTSPRIRTTLDFLADRLTRLGRHYDRNDAK